VLEIKSILFLKKDKLCKKNSEHRFCSFLIVIFEVNFYSTREYLLELMISDFLLFKYVHALNLLANRLWFAVILFFLENFHVLPWTILMPEKRMRIIFISILCFSNEQYEDASPYSLFFLLWYCQHFFLAVVSGLDRISSGASTVFLLWTVWSLIDGSNLII
jgi:hypothetical protein